MGFTASTYRISTTSTIFSNGHPHLYKKNYKKYIVKSMALKCQVRLKWQLGASCDYFITTEDPNILQTPLNHQQDAKVSVFYRVFASTPLPVENSLRSEIKSQHTFFRLYASFPSNPAFACIEGNKQIGSSSVESQIFGRLGETPFPRDVALETP